MKRFVIKTIIIILPIIIGFVSLEIILRQIPNDYNFKKNYLEKHSPEIETLILGSSHSFYGIDPKYFSDNSFNSSHVSQSLDYDYKILMKYKNELNNLKTVIIPISYFTLWGRLENGIEAWRCKNYVMYYNMPSHNLKDYAEVLGNNFCKSIKRAGSFVINRNKQISCSSLGWGTTYKSENAKDLAETGNKAALRHTRDNIESEQYREIYSENILYLNEILKWSESKNINVVLFTPPAFETYRNNLNPIQLEKTIQTSEKIASEFKNCTYVNMLYDKTFVANDFFDADHLSEIGAKKLSLKLNRMQQ